MPLFTKKQFATMCDMPTNRLSIYIGRNKVQLTDDLIDSDLEINKYFLEKHAVNSVPQQQNPEKKPQAKSTKKDSQSNNSDASGTINTDPSQKSSLFALDQRLKVLEAKKREKEIELLNIKEQKLRGEAIPTDLVKIIFGQHFKSIGTTFKNATETIITNIGKKKALNVNEIAELRSVLNGILNDAISESIQESKKNIKNIVEEYSVKRGVGERA